MKKFVFMFMAVMTAMLMVSCSDSDNEPKAPDYSFFDRAVFNDVENLKATIETGTEMEIWAIHANFDRCVFDDTARIVDGSIVAGLNGVGRDGETIIMTHNYLNGAKDTRIIERPTYEMSPIACGFPISMADAVYRFRTLRGTKIPDGQIFNVPDTQVITIALPLKLTLESRHPHYIITADQKTLYCIDALTGYPYVFKEGEK